MIRLLGLLGRIQIRGPCPLVIKRIELVEGCGAAIIPDGVAHGLIAAEVGQVQEIAGVAALDQNLRLLGEDLATGLAEYCGTGLEVALHVGSGHGLGGEAEDVSAA